MCAAPRSRCERTAALHTSPLRPPHATDEYRDSRDLTPRCDVQAIRGDAGAATGGHVRPQSNQDPAAPHASGSTRADKAPATRSSFAFGPKKPAAPLTARDAGFRHPDGAVTPAHTVVERGCLDLTNAWADTALAAPTSVPEALVVRVSLPRLASAAAVELDVSCRELTLRVPGRFRLDAALPHDVDGQKAAAKFDKAAGTLTVTAPVLAPPPPARQRQGAASLGAMMSDSLGRDELECACSEAVEAAPSAHTGSMASGDSRAVQPASSTRRTLGSDTDLVDCAFQSTGGVTVPADILQQAVKESNQSPVDTCGLGAQGVATPEVQAGVSLAGVAGSVTESGPVAAAGDAGAEVPFDLARAARAWDGAHAHLDAEAASHSTPESPEDGGGPTTGTHGDSEAIAARHSAPAPRLEMALDFDLVSELD